jgi:hypothetical protein
MIRADGQEIGEDSRVVDPGRGVLSQQSNGEAMLLHPTNSHLELHS